MYRSESWILKKAECWRIDAFELWCWRRLLKIPWTARRSNQSILKEVHPGCSLEGLLLKLKLQYFGHPMWRVDSLEKTLMLGGIEEKGTTEYEMAGWHHWLDGHEFEWTPGVGDGQGGLACCDSWGGRVWHDWVTELNWTYLRVNSLVVQGLGVNAPSPKAQNLISGQEQRSTYFVLFCFMALSEIKTNTKKLETKGEPQTNGSYKIGK